MQNRSVNERILKADTTGASRDKNKILLDYTLSSMEDDPFLVMSAEASLTFDKNQYKNGNEHATQDSTRRSKKQPSKGRKTRGKQEIQPISSNSNIRASGYHNESIMQNTNNYKQGSDNRIELEDFSNKNSYAKYTKNLQFREKLPKKGERERSTPSRQNLEYIEKHLISESLETDDNLKHQTTSVDQYKSYLNNQTWNQES